MTDVLPDARAARPPEPATDRALRRAGRRGRASDRYPLPVVARVTLSDVARQAGVSLATASRALNGSSNRTVQPALRERVVAAAAELRYAPDANAQAMARGATTSVGLVVHDIADPYFSTIAAAVTRAADRVGLHVTLASTQNEADREIELVALMQRLRARAVIVAGGRLADPDREERLRAALLDLQAGGASVALVGQPLDGVDSVVIDNAGGARDLALALWGLGYRRAAILGGPTDRLTAQNRRDGFVTAWAGAGGRIDPADVVHGAFTWEGGAEAMTTLLRTRPRPEVVFAANDVMALGALSAARALGVRVPEDVAVAGFDDIATLRDVVPGLTTVRIPLDEAGEAAAELALTPRGDEVRATEIRTEVVLRDSTPPRG
ncbi:LacI family DNA-binding transcriptional regulator [Cellulomonas marina]|uniref:LacI family transcriptional regulator n=1 Tax=Cellulomonas marina TaxID=988821 RepID=A0A1I1AJQ1_9CELL|nr:LacI family DNA-binding transcriptional regulator [Cellulomonas marina]GIG30154.1 LacI family transcriptional regulator [Cellulomonas marina]SFB38261.1 LacI family transcriptional regulator [Cellulomonas marina]